MLLIPPAVSLCMVYITYDYVLSDVNVFCRYTDQICVLLRICVAPSIATVAVSMTRVCQMMTDVGKMYNNFIIV